MVTRALPPGSQWLTITEEVGIPLPTFEGFCCLHGIPYKRLWQWKRRYPEFADAVERAKSHQTNIFMVNAFLGYYQQSFCVFFMKAVIIPRQAANA